MLVVRSNACRFVLLPFLLTASLLIPTLHLHPVHEHDHDGHPHQHTIMHADFFSVAAHDHHSAQQENVAFGESEGGHVSQIAFSALLVRNSDSLLTRFEQTAGFFTVDTNLVAYPGALRIGNQKRNHSPPVQNFLSGPTAPRSPPVFV